MFLAWIFNSIRNSHMSYSGKFILLSQKNTKTKRKRTENNNKHIYNTYGGLYCFFWSISTCIYIIRLVLKIFRAGLLLLAQSLLSPTEAVIIILMRLSLCLSIILNVRWCHMLSQYSTADPKHRVASDVWQCPGSFWMGCNQNTPVYKK